MEKNAGKENDVQEVDWEYRYISNVLENIEETELEIEPVSEADFKFFEESKQFLDGLLLDYWR